MAVSQRYISKLLRFLQCADGHSTTEIKSEFPRAPLRDLEKLGKIIYVQERWHAVCVGDTEYPTWAQYAVRYNDCVLFAKNKADAEAKKSALSYHAQEDAIIERKNNRR